MAEDLRNYLFRSDIIILLFLATIIGSLFRWQLNNDLLANLLGSAILGLVLGLKINPKFRLTFTIGFCSSFTTFSGWIWDVMELMRSGFFLRALVLILSSMIGGLLVLSFGYWFGKTMRHVFNP